MRRLKDTVKLNRPFAVFIEPGDVCDDGRVQWNAKVVGHELDNMTWGASPILALEESIALLCTLSGTCTPEKPAHNWIIETKLDDSPAWECARCGEVVVATEFVNE